MIRSFLRKLCAVIIGLGFASSVFAQAEANAALRLQVVTPALWRVLPEQRFIDLFTGSLSQALRDRGQLPALTELGAMEDPANVPYLLTVNVTDWHVTDSGNIACSFSAKLKTPAGETVLGDYADTVWAPGVVYPNSGYAYYPLSGTAIRDLSARLSALELPKGPRATMSPKRSSQPAAAFAALRPAPVF